MTISDIRKRSLERRRMKIESLETIQETTADDYLELLERMVEEGMQRNDPTLAVAISINTLFRLVREARAFRMSGSISTEAATIALARAMHVARGAYGEFGVEGDCECLADAEAWLDDGAAPEDDRSYAHFVGVAEFEQ